jgi:signal peptidase I
MTDLETRLRDVERVVPPDLWAEALSRRPRESDVAGHGSRRVAAFAAAAVLVAAGVLVPLGLLRFGSHGTSLGGLAPPGHEVVTIREPSESMLPTIRVGQDVAVDVDAYKEAPPARPDVVAFHAKDAGPGFVFLKRVIGVAGDVVQVRDGVVSVNGLTLDEPYVAADHDSSNYGPATVPAGRLFVLGDHRANSNDSRFSVGFVPVSDVIGKVLLAVEPPGVGEAPPAQVASGPSPGVARSPADVWVNVRFDISSHVTAAEVLAKRLRDAGYQVAQPSLDVPRQTSLIYYGRGFEIEAAALRDEFLPGVTIELARFRLGADIMVLLAGTQAASASG